MLQREQLKRQWLDSEWVTEVLQKYKFRYGLAICLTSVWVQR